MNKNIFLILKLTLGLALVAQLTTMSVEAAVRSKAPVKRAAGKQPIAPADEASTGSTSKQPATTRQQLATAQKKRTRSEAAVARKKEKRATALAPKIAAATTIQAALRGKLARNRVEKLRQKATPAASPVQPSTNSAMTIWGAGSPGQTERTESNTLTLRQPAGTLVSSKTTAKGAMHSDLDLTDPTVFRRESLKAHPDKGGSTEAFTSLAAARAAQVATKKTTPRADADEPQGQLEAMPTRLQITDQPAVQTKKGKVKKQKDEKAPKTEEESAAKAEAKKNKPAKSPKTPEETAAKAAKEEAKRLKKSNTVGTEPGEPTVGSDQAATQAAKENAAATKIQAVLRGNQVRKKVLPAARAEQTAKENAAATKIQAVLRGHQVRKKVLPAARAERDAQQAAATSANRKKMALGAAGVVAATTLIGGLSALVPSSSNSTNSAPAAAGQQQFDANGTPVGPNMLANDQYQEQVDANGNPIPMDQNMQTGDAQSSQSQGDQSGYMPDYIAQQTDTSYGQPVNTGYYGVGQGYATGYQDANELQNNTQYYTNQPIQYDNSLNYSGYVEQAVPAW